MSTKKFDTKTTKKLIASYQSTIAKYTKENADLLSQLQDLKTTLALNQDLLYDFISNSLGENNEIEKLINESKVLWKENEKLVQEKNELEIKTSKLQELIEDTPTEIREELKNINASNEKMKAQLMQKDAMIKKLKADLEKARKNALFKTARTEILVTEPTRINVEINHELLNTKSILSKVSKMHATEKKKADKLDKEVKSLQEEVIALRRNITSEGAFGNGKNTSNLQSDPDEDNDIGQSPGKKIKTTSGIGNKLNFGKVTEGKQMQTQIPNANKNKDFSAVSSDGGEEEEGESESSDSANSYDLRKEKKKPKSKQKELDMLTEEYNKLKKINEEYESKIQKYKTIYKDMKSKIQNLNQISRGQVKSERRNNNNILLASTDDATSHKNI